MRVFQSSARSAAFVALCFGTLLVSTVFLGTPIVAGQSRPLVSAGYAAAWIVEEEHPDPPFSGAYVSLSSPKGIPLELLVAYQRRTVDYPYRGYTLEQEVLQAGIGPRFATRDRNMRPFVHALLGARRDSSDRVRIDAFTTTGGGGVDFLLRREIGVRVGVDYQIAFHRGENLETVNLSIGIAG